jgi:outer membrane lipoprotein-sorting protein
MRKIILSVMILLVAGLTVAAQQNPKAKAALDKAVALVKSTPVKIVFATTVETAQNRKQNFSGTIYLKGDKFKLQMNGSESYFDGKTEWVYVPENNEVTISGLTAKEQRSVNPLAVLSQYEGKTTKIGFVQDAKAPVGSQLIDIYPPVGSANEFRIVVKLDQRTSSPQSIVLYGRDGSRTTLTIKSLQKISPDASFFTFNVKEHSRVSVNDLR